ncbi:Na(+)/citrate cotransporter-like isoform X2 [Mytilus trossulus]|uniref:Na(+)/citrate cotransporter-like isoform X2 n=1 Tax=Mytilus trossulus TaxID=6551 RepID=UPI003006F112
MANRGALWFLKNVYAIRSWIIIIIAFVVPCKLIICQTPESKCLYVICVMGLCYVTEAVPISVTSLFPIFLFPMLGIATAKHVSSKYVNDTSMLFFGGLIVAVAIEETGLHKRIALGIMKLVGVSPNMLLLGLMVPTWFLSMWISNTATTSMMLPIITAVIDQMKIAESDDDSNYVMDKKDNSNGPVSEKDVKIEISDTQRQTTQRKSEEIKRLSKAFALSVAYAANTGGIATLVGTPPNLVLQSVANTKYDAIKKGTDAGITFANWMGFAILLSLIMLILSWFWIQLLFIRCGCLNKANRSRSKAIKTAIDQEFKKLGKITFAEVTVLIVFICLAILWIFRDLPDIHGWSLAFKTKYVSDSTASILMACLLFILPAEVPNVFCWNKISSTTNEYEKSTYRPILNWQVTNQKVPWGVLVLLGGGFALADASQISGLSKWLSCELSSINEYEPWIINLIICCVVAGATEVTSNTATATLLLPIMFDLAIGLNLHPLYMMISVCIACSFAFMLPVATPPNAIVFSTGYLKIYDMVFAGIVMNIIGIAVLTLAVNTWAEPIFNLDTIPEMFRNISSNTNNACIQLCPN